MKSHEHQRNVAWLLLLKFPFTENLHLPFPMPVLGENLCKSSFLNRLENGDLSVPFVIEPCVVIADAPPVM